MNIKVMFKLVQPKVCCCTKVFYVEWDEFDEMWRRTTTAHYDCRSKQDFFNEDELCFLNSEEMYKVIIVGGLSHFIDASVYEHLSTVSKGEYYNVVGFHSYALEKLEGLDVAKPKITRSRKNNL